MSRIRKLCWSCGRSGRKTGRSGFDVSGLKRLQKNLEKLEEKAEPFAQDCAGELGARVLAKAAERTPQGEKDGGALRRGWKMTPAARVRKNGIVRTVVYNAEEYASHVEYGHRVRGGKGFVEGRFMLEKACSEAEKSAPAEVENRLNKFLGGVFE